MSATDLAQALKRYEQARQLLGKENDLDALWKAIVAADAIYRALADNG